ncbi:MAG: hypothetical protein ABFD46_01385 [Armatimonadota bacterium]
MVSSLHLTTSQRVEALSIKVTELQKEISMLRRDVRQVLFLLQKDQDGKIDDHSGIETAPNS